MNTHAVLRPHTTSATTVRSVAQHHTPSFSVTPMVSISSIFWTWVVSYEGKPSHHSTAFLIQPSIDSSSRNVEANGKHLRCFYPSSLNLKHNGYLIRPPALLYAKKNWMKLIRLYTTCLDYKIDTNALH